MNPEIILEVRVVLFSLHQNRLQVLLLCSDPLTEARNLPGNLLAANCSFEATATQVLAGYMQRHETFLEQLYTYGAVQRMVNGSRLVSVVYYALVPADAILFSSDVSQAGWFPVAELPSLVSDVEEIIQYALRRLRYKLEYTAVGFELLPENFSLSELQSTYEIILGEKLDKRNFRRRILEAGVIEPTPHLRAGEGRPARLFRYRPDAVAEVKARRLFP